MTVDEVAAYLQVHPSTVYQMVKHRQLPCFRVGADWRFHPASIHEWIKERETAAH
jgi:excisionase family DNA binding protein